MRGPHSLPTRTVGSTLFGNVSSQQHTAFSAGPVSSVPQRPFKTPSLGFHNFQLASTNAFGGKNPFSPTQAGRTRSVDGFGEPKAVEEKRQAHSAPIVRQMMGESYFHFPSKSNLQFYLPRLKVEIFMGHFKLDLSSISLQCQVVILSNKTGFI